MFSFCSLNITDIQNHPLDQFERRLDSQVNDYSLEFELKLKYF